MFTADHHGYYQEGSPFIPAIQEHADPLMEWSNVASLRLPAHLNDDLSWTKEKEQAQQIIASGKFILWEIDLGLPSFTFTPENSAAFFSFSVALEEFSATLWPEFKTQTFGVALYRGEIPNKTNFPMGEWEAAYLESSLSYELFCTQMLSEYIHRLISFLPDSVLAFVIVDVSSISSPGKIAQLFSKERFEHVQVILKGDPCWSEYSSPGLGLYLPKDELLDASLIQELDKLMVQLKEKGTAYRIIPEDKLTEQWDGIDTLIVPEQAISSQGKRKLLGFAAASGTILSFEGRKIEFA